MSAASDALARALTGITGRAPPALDATLGELGVDSRHLVELMLACDTIYGAEVAFELLDISIDTTVAALHEQILELLAGAEAVHA